MTVIEINESDFWKCIKHKIYASESRLIEMQNRKVKRQIFPKEYIYTKQEEVLVKLFIN